MSVVDEAYEGVRSMLIAGHFKPGDKLREPDLATALGVSRTPLREALRSLQSEGLVTLAGRGAVVTRLSTQGVYDLYQYRAVLEGFTAEQAAQRNRDGELSPSQISALWAHEKAVENASTDSSRVESNLLLHQYVAELSGNNSAVEALSRVWAQISVSSAVNLTSGTWRGEMHEQHRSIVQAIEAGDPDQAFTAGRSHVRMAAEVFRRLAP